MNRIEFDKFVDEYHAIHANNISITGEEPEYFVEYKVRDIFHQMRARGTALENLRILDFGCGVGSSIPFYKRFFPSCHIVCADVSPRSLNLAMCRFGDLASYVLFDGRSLPLKSGVFDVAFAACVFHHIPTIEHAALLQEIHRVLSASSGLLFLYEHNPLNPLTIRAFNTCEFDRDAVLLPSWKMRRQVREAGYLGVSVRYRVFFPRFLAFLRFLELRLSWLPLGAQYCIAATAHSNGKPSSRLVLLRSRAHP